MFWVIHILIGIIISLELKLPLLIIPIAIISHFLLDYIPHWDGIFDKINFKKTGQARIPKTDAIIRLIDITLVIILVAFFYIKSSNAIIFLGAFMSIFPDIIKIGYFTPLKNNKIYLSYLKFHNNIQNETTIKKGILIQLILFVILIIIILNIGD